MLIGEQNKNQEQKVESVIPDFNPAAFLSDENEVFKGGVLKVSEEFQAPSIKDEVIDDGKHKTNISFDDSFIDYKTPLPAEVEFKAEDHKQLANSLGIEINSQEDLDNIKNKFAPKVDDAPIAADVSSYDFSKEESEKYNVLSNALETANKSSDDDLLKWHLKQTNKSVDYENNPEELDFHVENLKEMGMFEGQVKSVREDLIRNISTQKNGLIEAANERTTHSSMLVTKELETELKSYREGFHGITLTPNDVFEAFNSVKSGSLFAEVESSQANVAEMSLLWKNRQKFYNAFENPDNSPGIRKVFNDLQNSEAKPVTGATVLKDPLVFDPQSFLQSEEMKVYKG